MNTKSNKFIYSKNYIIALTILSIILVLATGTYAWFTWSTTDNTTLTMTIGSLVDVTFVSGNDINTGLTPVFNYYDGESTTFSVINKKDTLDETGYYTVKLNITTIPNELKREDVKYALVENDILVAEGNLSTATNGGSINVYTTSVGIGTTDYIFYLYIDGNEENPVTMQNKILVGELTVEPADDLVNLVNHMTDLYMGNKDATLITNNGIEYTYASIYDKDDDDTSSGGLMNDRLGGTTSDYDAGNIRYYGANPNNYVDIGDYYEDDIGNWVSPLKSFGLPNEMIPTTSEGCQTFMTCSNLVDLGMFSDATTCEAQLPYVVQNIGYSSLDELCSVTPAGTRKLYRIIGLFKNIEMEDGSKKNLVKVMNNSLALPMEWDNDSNDWHTSTIQEYLNTGEYFTELSQNVKNKIVTVKWNLGSTYSIDIYSNQMYGYERGNEKCQDCNYETIWPGKIALIYPSDYGYATNLANCSNTLTNYDENVACYSNDWLSTSMWLLTPGASSNDVAFSIYSDGTVYEIYPYMTVYSVMNAYPVMFLDPELSIVSGDGTETNPYVIK